MNNTKQQIRDYIDNMSLALVRQYSQTADRLLWIEYNILDMLNDGNGVSNRYAEYAERWLDATISEAHHMLKR